MNHRTSTAIPLVFLLALLMLADMCQAAPIKPLKWPVAAGEQPAVNMEKVVPNPAKNNEEMKWEGFISDQKDSFIKVVMNKSEWAELWQRAFDSPAPELDFENYAVACVFLGHSADWLYSINFGKPFERDNLLVIPFGLAEIILELSGPFEASGQYHMKVFKKRKGLEMILENTYGPFERKWPKLER